jgi:hypothetical protein
MTQWCNRISYRAAPLKAASFDSPRPLTGNPGYARESTSTLVLPSLPLNKETNLFENLFAHLDVPELRRMGKPELFPKPVEDGGVQVGPLVQQVEQFRGGGRVLIIGLDAARILYGDGQGKRAKVVGLLVG